MANTSILAAFERMWQHIVTALNNKSDISHDHNDTYYTEAEVNTLLSKKSDSTHGHDDKYDKKGSADASLSASKSYTDNAVSQRTQVQIITWEEND